MLLVYNYVLLKMSTWYSKHVEESNNILRINNIQCITLVILYGEFMMHGQRNIKLNLYLCHLLVLFSPCWMRNMSQCSHYAFVTSNVILSEWLQLKKNSQKYFISLHTAAWFAMKTLLSPFGSGLYHNVLTHKETVYSYVLVFVQNKRWAPFACITRRQQRRHIIQPYTYLFHVLSKNKFLCQISMSPYHGIKQKGWISYINYQKKRSLESTSRVWENKLSLIWRIEVRTRELIMYRTPTHALFCSKLYYSSVLISLKYIKIFNGTPTCFDLNRSSSGSMTVPC